jgi:hypothetical protein
MIKIDAAARLQAGNPCLATVLTEADFHQLVATFGHSNVVTAHQVEALDLWQKVKDAGLTKKLMSFIKDLRAMINRLVSELGLELAEVIAAFQTKPMFAFFKAIKFSLSLLIKPIHEFTKLYQAGILKIFAELHKTGALQKLNKGAVKVDELFDRYPLLRRLAGPAIAGLMLWMWLSANFTGEPGLDMDLTNMIKAALYGHWSAAELFTSPAGLAALGLLVAGLLTPWPSPLWLNEALPFNLMVALCYTAFKHLKGETATATKIRKHMKMGHL